MTSIEETQMKQTNEDAFSKKFQDRMIEELKDRVSQKRFDHIMGVANTAKKLARTYDTNEDEAYLAGLLHDWDKGYDNQQIRERIVELGMQEHVDPWVVQHMPQVLHGPTAAAALAKEHPCIPKKILTAIEKHTTSDVEMNELDQILYIADAIEPSRTFKEADRLRDLVGKVPLEELYFQIYKFWTLALFEHDIVLHPETINIWNSLAANRPKEHKGKGKGHHGKRRA